MLAPRKTFREDDRIVLKNWQNLVDSALFVKGAETALLEMAIRNTNPPDMASAASYQHRMDGAKQFLAILMGLALAEPNQPKTNSGRLDHTA